jgi:hypothetical protein
LQIAYDVANAILSFQQPLLRGRWALAHRITRVGSRPAPPIQQTTRYRGKRIDLVMAQHKRWLFRTADGRRPYSINGLSRRLLRHCELLTNNTGATRTPYSMQHTYATAEPLTKWKYTLWLGKWELKWLCWSGTTASSLPRWLRVGWLKLIWGLIIKLMCVRCFGGMRLLWTP